MELDSNMIELCLQRQEICDKMISLLSTRKNVTGVTKLEKKIEQEKRFLTKLLNTRQVQKGNVNSSNVTHFEALVSTFLNTEDCTSLLETFSYEEDGKFKKINIDIVAKNGRQWIKVIARSPKSLTSSCSGDCKFGHRSLVHQAKDIQACALQNPAYFTAPSITFRFVNGIPEDLATKLSSLGIIICGTIIEFDNKEEMESQSDGTESEEDPLDTTTEVLKAISKSYDILKLNLDTTALLAYVSAMTNEEDHPALDDEILNQQLKAEQSVQVKDMLEDLFGGKELYCCETAACAFQDILSTVGGEEEKSRSAELMKRVTVVSDCISERVKQLRVGGKINKRSQIIFGTGDAMQAVTVTANQGFYRAAKNQGVQLSVIFHEARALSEKKIKFKQEST